MEELSGAQTNIYTRITMGIQLVLILAAVILFFQKNWFDLFATLLLIGFNLLPVFLYRRYQIVIPPEFEFIAVLFVFAAVFMGTVRGLYVTLPWWDTLLHTTSGFLLGIIGFLAIFVLNRTDHIPRGMSPFFMCFFAVTFAVFLGVVWELVEFGIDLIWPQMDMQFAASGVQDTMIDLMVDTIGAIVVAIFGYAYMRSGKFSFLANGIRGFVQKNPRFFGST